MGCDIHWYVEKKQADGTWKLVWPQLVELREELIERGEDPDKFPGLVVDDYEELRKHWDDKWNSALYVGRNYDLFAMLADVRNGYGFAGVDTGDGFEIMDDPRGVPDDASEEYKREVEGWGVDGHSHSYFTLRELLEWEGWDYGTEKRGVVGPTGYMQWKELGRPASWSGAVSGASVRNVSNEEMEKLIEGGAVEVGSLTDSGFALDSGANVYTKVEWRVTYRDSVERFLDHVLPAMKEFGDPDEVRAVFFFDN